MSKALDGHLTAEQLRAFSQGRIEQESVIADISGHIETCEECRETLATFKDDSLVELVRAGDSPAPLPQLANFPEAFRQHPKYEILGQIGTGGMGAVYKAWDRVMERFVALKVIHPKILQKPAAVDRFRREAKAAARLTHPNTVRAHNADQAGDTHFLDMEYVEGESLDRVVEGRGPLSIAEACSFISQAASGLQHAHEQGLVHRDIKPQNLMLVPDSGPHGHGTVKVLDFGMARLVSEFAASDALTECGAVLGTPGYMGPEQVVDPHSADIRADIYGLGCTLYFLLSGQPPFPGGSAQGKLLAQTDSAPLPLSQHRSDLPEELQQMVERMMAKNPDERYQTPVEVSEALASFVNWDSNRAFTCSVRDKDNTESSGTVAWQPVFRLPLTWWKIQRPWVKYLGVVLAVTTPVLLAIACYQIIIRVYGPGGKKLAEIEIKNHPKSKPIKGNGDPLSAVPPIIRKLPLFQLDGGPKYIRRTERPVKLPAGVVAILGERTHIQGEAAYAAAFTPNGKRLLFTRAGKTVLWDIKTWAQVYAWPDQYATHIAIAPSGKVAATSGFGRGVRLFDLESGQMLHTFTWPRDDRGDLVATDMAFSPNGKYLVVCTREKEYVKDKKPGSSIVRMWDLKTRRQIHEFKKHAAVAQAVVFAPDGGTLVSAGQGKTVRSWDTKLGKPLHSKSMTRQVFSLAMAPDGKTLVVGSRHGELQVWQYAKGEMKHRLDLTAHRTAPEISVKSLAFSPDGYFMASADGDGRLILWQVPSFKKVHEWGMAAPIQSVAFSPEGWHLACANYDGTVYIIRRPLQR